MKRKILDEGDINDWQSQKEREKEWLSTSDNPAVVDWQEDRGEETDTTEEQGNRGTVVMIVGDAHKN